MPAIAAVIFDLDDTLYPEWQYVLGGYRAVCRHLGERSAQAGRFEQFLWGRFCRGLSAGAPTGLPAAERQRERPGQGAFDALNDRFLIGLDSRQVAQLVGIYRGHAPDIRPFGSIPQTLGLLHSRYRLGLLSDGYMPAQRLKLEALGLARFFDAVVFTEEMGREAWKPSPAGFNRIGEMLDAPHEACAYIADNPAKDFIAPNALGWLTVRYVQPGQVHAARRSSPAPANQPLEGSRPKATVHLPGELYQTLVQWR